MVGAPLCPCTVPTVTPLYMIMLSPIIAVDAITILEKCAKVRPFPI